MAKVLRALTIIPDELYVERAADRQLASIVANMGRPGYVLVARQMGKTNLLLHARRRAASNGLFIYLDLSNSFPDLRSFLRNIIDVAMEGLPTLVEAMHQIRLARSNLERLPHKEHEWELRVLLAEIQGSVVVCLDEIDSLTKSDYSDQVFSFVRSVYFSGRANFPELERLTYILSGVAEPSDIIKNRDISPFNIGEKILLHDFGFDELEQLVIRSKLPIPAHALERVYGWTNGHPRMSWDILSQLEDVLLAGFAVEASTVDQVVRDLYFAEVNMPPVDQIKRIAEDAAEIRDALISVHYGRGESVPDAIRTKLYLAGICQAPQAKTVKFKNKILEEALSERFLLSIVSTEGNAASLHVGEQQFNIGELVSALNQFGLALKASQETNDSAFEARARYWLARTKFRLGELESASADFLEASSRLDGELALLNSFYFGHLYLVRELYKEARTEFENVVRGAAGTALALEAAVDLATAIVAIDPLDKGATAEDICKRVCRATNEILNAPGQERMGGDTLAMAHYILAGIYLRRNKRGEAMHETELGLETAGLDVQVRLILLQADGQPDKRDFYLLKANALILSGASVEYGPPAKFVSYEAYRDLIIRLERASRTDDALHLIEYMFGSATSESELVLLFDRIGADVAHGGATVLAIRIFEQILRNYGHKFSGENIRRFIVTICNVSPERSFVFSGQFLDIVEAQGGGINASELVLVGNIIFYSVTTKNFVSAQRALALLKMESADLAIGSTTQQTAWRIYREYWELYTNLAFQPSAQHFDQALQLFWTLQGIRSLDLPAINSEFVESMRITLERELKLNAGLFGEVRRIRKIGRNEVVVVQYGGQMKKGKYKQFVADLQAGRCSLVDFV